MKKRFYLVIALGVLGIYVALTTWQRKQSITPYTQRHHYSPWITVWAPGTHPDELVLPQAFKLIDEQQYVHLFYCPQWVKAAEFGPQYHHYQIAKTLASTDPNNFPFDQIYLGGWSGKLDFKARKQTAQKFLTHFKKLIKEYTNTFGIPPKLRVITHSHGGNVILNMAQFNDPNNPIIIDELVLLACPVQKETATFVNNTMFKNVYSLHSHMDLIQIMDPQGWKDIKPLLEKFFANVSLSSAQELLALFGQNFFSGRHFEPSSNLKQVHVKNGTRGLLHLEFMLLPFVQKLPALLEKLKTAQQPKKGTDIVVRI